MMEATALNLAYINQEKSGIKRLTLSNFRNYQFLRFEPAQSPVVICGNNGTGKTNILEAISFLTPGKGMRSSKLSEVQRLMPAVVHGEENKNFSWAVSAIVTKNEEEFVIGTGIEKNAVYDKRIVQVDGQKISSQSELGRYVSALWLTPQMDRIFQRGSQPRRSFLDRLVYAFDNEHAKRTASFEHLYKEWFALIKSGCNDNNWLFSLEEQMASFGVAIAAARREHITKLNSFIASEAEGVFPSVVLDLDGVIEKKLDEKSALDVEDFYRIMLFNSRRNVLGSEFVEGVNRTDFKVFHKKKKMPAELCSTGEQKALLVSIVLAQAKAQTLHQGFAPILLLDEIVAHLDEQKKEVLLQKIIDLRVQAFITTTDADLFSSIKDSSQFFEIKNNSIYEF